MKRNAGTFTYDGIETGGERVTREIEDTLEEYARNGIQIRKMSVVGYSLGKLLTALLSDGHMHISLMYLDYRHAKDPE